MSVAHRYTYIMIRQRKLPYELLVYLPRGNGQCGHCPSRRGGTHRGRAAGARKQLAAVGQGARLGHEASPRTYTVCTTTRVTLRLSKACAPSMLASAYCRPAGGIRRVGVITKSTKAQAQPTARRQSGTRLWRLPFARVPRASVRSKVIVMGLCLNSARFYRPV